MGYFLLGDEAIVKEEMPLGEFALDWICDHQKNSTAKEKLKKIYPPMGLVGGFFLWYNARVILDF